MAEKWKRRLARPMRLTDGRKLATLAAARDYALGLPAGAVLEDLTRPGEKAVTSSGSV